MALKPTITIGTGYEQMQKKAASRRKIAEAMLAQGLQSNPNMSSWAQVLGQMAQAWAGKSMQKDADKMEADVSGLIRQDYNSRRGTFLQDAQTMAPGDLVAKYGADPLLQDDLKPYMDAQAAALRNRESLVKFGGRAGVRVGDVQGQYDNDPNESVHVVDGMMVPNGPKIAASIASQGKPLADDQGNLLYQPMAPVPGGSTLATMPQATPQKVPENKTVSMGEARQVLQSLPPAQIPAAIQRMKQSGLAVAVATPEEAETLPSGTPIVLPDGTLGVVP